MEPLEKQIIEPLLALGITTIAFMIYHFFGFSSEPEGSVTFNIKRKAFGAVIYGIAPAIFFFVYVKAPVSSIGITVSSDIKAFPWIAGLAGAAIALGSVSAKNEKGLKLYPQIRVSEWTPSVVAATALSWIVYLTAYEFLFRGFLLFSWYRAFGFWPAITVNIAVYVLVHVPKGMSESFGSIIAGFIFCFLTLKSGTILIALCVHIALALSNEFWSLAYHPDMRLGWQRKS